MLIIFLLVMCGTSCINIYAHWVEDGLVGRLLYMAVAVSCLAGVVHLWQGEPLPPYISNTLLALIAVKSVRHLCAKYIRYRKYLHVAKHLR